MAEGNVATCPHCGHRNQLASGAVPGPTVTCEACGRIFSPGTAASSPAEAGRPAVAGTPPGPLPATTPAAPFAAPPHAPPNFEHLGYGAPAPASGGNKLLIIVLVALLGGAVLVCGCMVSILLPSLNRAREQANRVKCASNMRMIANAVQMYANQNRGVFPDTLDRLITAGFVQSDVFVCPSSSDTAAPGSDNKTQAANLQRGGHLSYVYVGKGLNTRAPANAVLAYEPMTNHSNDGTNILFADGTVQFVKAAQAQQIIAEVQAGKNPPTAKAY